MSLVLAFGATVAGKRQLESKADNEKPCVVFDIFLTCSHEGTAVYDRLKTSRGMYTQNKLHFVRLMLVCGSN